MPRSGPAWISSVALVPLWDKKLIPPLFLDPLGRMKGMILTRREIEKVLQDDGQGFDGSSIEGLVPIQESDLLARPLPETFKIVPWQINGQTMAAMICAIYNPDGTRNAGDGLWVLERTVRRLAQKGYKAYLGPELEFFLFKKGTLATGNPVGLDQEGYFSLVGVFEGTTITVKAADRLEKMGIPVECIHHEVAASQHEIDLLYQDPITMAHNVVFYRWVVKETAAEFGCEAVFLPKPIFGINGSGMHTHQSLFIGNNNVFFSTTDRDHLSRIAKHYIAGILQNIRTITLVTNPRVNSYKRLVPGYEAPVYISWARRNRSALVRIPWYKPGKENATRVELRSPDPSCNPYLAFSLMLEMGLKGIDQKLDLPEAVEEDIYHMSTEQRQELDIATLPGSLEEALSDFEAAREMLEPILGSHIFNVYLTSKRKEWEEYCMQVTIWELNYDPGI